jgi:hypothetical protein
MRPERGDHRGAGDEHRDEGLGTHEEAPREVSLLSYSFCSRERLWAVRQLRLTVPPRADPEVFSRCVTLQRLPVPSDGVGSVVSKQTSERYGYRRRTL